MSSPRDITHAMRNQLNSTTKVGTDTTNVELDVQVQVERAVVVDYEARHGREYFQKPQRIWDRKQGTSRGERSSGERNQWELSSVNSAANTMTEAI